MSFIENTRAAFQTAVNEAFPQNGLSFQGALQWGGRDTYLWTGTPGIAKQLQLDSNAVAEQIRARFFSDEVEIKGIQKNGAFIVAIKMDALVRRLQLMDQDSSLGVFTPPQQRVIVDFSAPNIAKELHVGHLRSTIIGDALARVQEFLGHDVLRLNHVGDWGTQFGMLICYLKENEIDVSSLDLTQLMQCYRKSRAQFDLDEDFKTRARVAVTELQSESPESIRIWKQICEVSRSSFQKIYDDLDVDLIERGESFYNPFLKPLVDDLLHKGIATEHDGAICVFDDKYQSPYMLRKSDGGYSYDTTDLAALQQRIEEEGAEKILYVVDSGQSQHLEQMKLVAIKAGILNPEKTDVQHVGFGVVQGADGKKYKTRSGEVALLKDLVQEAISRADTELKTRGIDDPLAAKKLGIGALKYADLKNSRLKDYIFDSNQMLQMQGDTAPYLLYALVRARSILKNKTVQQDAPIVLNNKEEQTLGIQLVHFSDVIADVDANSELYHLCGFLFHVAKKFNAFYTQCVVQDDQSRLRLCVLTEKVLGKGLSLLGIQSLERM